ncbi:MAG TPA: histidine kinase N-terminal 7TM domain-containing protein, partial [Armatimonadota bacterium]
MLFLTICVNIVLICLVLTHTKPSQPGRIFIWLLVSMSLWILGEAIIDLPGTSKDIVIFCARAMHVAGGCGLVTWIWFCHDITGRAPRQRPLLWVLSLSCIPWCFFAWTALLIVDSTQQPWGDYLVTGPLTLAYTLWVALLGGTGIYFLVHTLLRARGHLRAQLLYIIAGMLFLLCVDILTCLLLPIFFSSMVFSRFGPLSTIVTTTTATYAIIRYRLMDIRIVLRAGLTYLLTGATTLLVAFMFLQLAVTFLNIDHDFRIEVMVVMLVLAMSMIVHPIWKASAYLAGKFFIKSPYNFEATLERMSILLAAAFERQTVIDIIAGTLRNTLRPLGFRLYLANRGESAPWQEYRFGEVTDIPEHAPLVETLLALEAPTDDILFTEQLLRDPRGHSVLGLLLQQYNLAFACPMTAQGKVNGLLCLAEKSSGDIYSDSDIILIRSMANYAALAWESTLAYEAIQEMNQQLEYRVQERTNALVSANEQLHQANQILKEADKAKDEFLAYLSHELLTPLTSIL